MLCCHGDEGSLSSCRGENSDYSHQFVTLESPWNNLSGFGHISVRERETSTSEPSTGRLQGHGVLEEAEGDSCIWPEEMTKAGAYLQPFINYVDFINETDSLQNYKKGNKAHSNRFK